jgi:hyperosmotically inducible periplasmic protein
MRSTALTLLAALVLLLGVACNRAGSVSYKDGVKQALEQADLKDVTVSEDTNRNTITLGGKVHSDEAKQKAADVAHANAGARIIANEVSVEPVGAESDAKTIASNVDDGIEKNYKAALVAKGLNKQSIRYDAKNGVLTLKGSVKSAQQKQEAQQLAQNVPNVQQVLNEIEVRR